MPYRDRHSGNYAESMRQAHRQSALATRKRIDDDLGASKEARATDYPGLPQSHENGHHDAYHLAFKNHPLFKDYARQATAERTYSNVQDANLGISHSYVHEEVTEEAAHHKEELKEARKKTGLPPLEKWNRRADENSGEIQSYSHMHGNKVFVINKKPQGSYSAHIHYWSNPSKLLGDFNTPEKAHAAIKKNKLHEEDLEESTPAGVPVPGAEKSTGANKYVKIVDGRWALVSRRTGKPLKFYKGQSKPSDEWADKALRTVEYFKHGGG